MVQKYIPRNTRPLRNGETNVWRQSAKEIFFDLSRDHQVIVGGCTNNLFVRNIWIEFLLQGTWESHPNLRPKRMGDARFDHVAQFFCSQQTWLNFIPCQVTDFCIVGKFQICNPHQPDGIKKSNDKETDNKKKLRKWKKYLCCGSSMNGVLSNLLLVGSGPSSSSTRKPNSSNLH